MNFLSKKNIFISSLVLATLVGGGYFFSSVKKSSGEVGGTSLLKEIEFKNTGKRFVPNGWQEFRSEFYGFSILYKDELAIKQFEEGGGASTFTFENASSTLGFQLFVVPYGEEKISQERFLKDSPLGVRENQKDFKIDTVIGTSFYGKNETLGDTYEVWFIRNGLLYEASIPRSLEVWFLDIIETWLFL